jgi:hypothetical protein
MSFSVIGEASMSDFFSLITAALRLVAAGFAVIETVEADIVLGFEISMMKSNV